MTRTISITLGSTLIVFHEQTGFMLLTEPNGDHDLFLSTGMLLEDLALKKRTAKDFFELQEENVIFWLTVYHTDEQSSLIKKNFESN